MAKSPDAFRTISEVADWLDTPAHVLRFWESKFTQVKPVKRAGGRRYYRPDDMLLLGGIKKLLHDDGMTIKGVQKLLREQGVRHVTALAPPLDAADAPPQMPPPARRPVREDVEEAEIVVEGEDEVPPAPFVEAEPPEATVLSFPGRTPVEANMEETTASEALRDDAPLDDASQDDAPAAADPVDGPLASGETDADASGSEDAKVDASQGAFEDTPGMADLGPAGEDRSEPAPDDADLGSDMAEVAGWNTPPDTSGEDAFDETGSADADADLEAATVGTEGAFEQPEDDATPYEGAAADDTLADEASDRMPADEATHEPDPGEDDADHPAPPPAVTIPVAAAPRTPPAGLLGPLLAADRGALRKRRARLAGPVARLTALAERMGRGPS